VPLKRSVATVFPAHRRGRCEVRRLLSRGEVDQRIERGGVLAGAAERAVAPHVEQRPGESIERLAVGFAHELEPQRFGLRDDRLVEPAIPARSVTTAPRAVT